MSKPLPWQKHMPTLNSFREQLNTDGISDELISEINTAVKVILGQPYVRRWTRKGEPRLAETNDHERAYSMGQGGMAVQLMKLYFTLKDNGINIPEYYVDALAMMDVVVDRVGKGKESGQRIRTKQSADTAVWCSWFTAVTNPRHLNPIGALNKHLDLMGDAARMADLVGEFDNVRANRYKKAAIEGLNQLFYAPRAKDNKYIRVPNFNDFIIGREHPEIYYGWKKRGKPYYIKFDPDDKVLYWKNSNYHVRVLIQVARLLLRFLDYEITTDVQKILEKIYVPYAQGLPSFDPSKTDPLPSSIVAFYENYI